MYRVLIAGAGYVGSSLCAHFRFKNQKVWGLIRTDKRKEALEQIGVTPVVADMARPETLSDIPPAHFIVIAVAPENRDPASYRKIYVEGVGNLLSRIKQNPAPNLVVYISSTGVYGEKQEGPVDEATPPEPDTERGRILLEAEKQVLNAGLPALVFRLSGIYGPGRNWVADFRRGEWPGKEGDRYMNMIHLEDIVTAMPVIFNKGEAGTVYLGTDDEPVKRSVFTQWLADRLGMTAQEAVSGRAGGKRCSNQRLKALGISLKYPTFREGYGALIKGEALKI